jgi:hypothetical protein
MTDVALECEFPALRTLLDTLDITGATVDRGDHSRRREGRNRNRLLVLSRAMSCGHVLRVLSNEIHPASSQRWNLTQQWKQWTA